MKSLSKIFVKLALFFLKGGSKLGQGLKQVLTIIWRPFCFFGRKFGRYFLLPIYKSQLYIKKKIFNFYSPARSKLFLVLTKKYVVHILVICLTLFVFVGNINAQEIREEGFGEDTVMYAIFNETPQFEIVEETAIFQPQEKILSYLDMAGQVEGTRTVEDVAVITEEQIAEELSAITGGGTAVLKPNITEIGLSTAPRKDVFEHAVQEGETVSTIAELYDISTNTVLWANDLGTNSYINPGNKLRILPTSGIEHTVKKGDTVKSLANKYDLDEDKIIEYNRLTDDGVITLEQTLMLPGAEKISPIVPRSTVAQYGSRPAPSIRDVFKKPADSAQVAAGAMVWPTSGRVITQYYGWRHTGLDVDGHYDSPIYSVEAGTIITAGWNSGGYGNYVIIDHGGGVVTLYAHLSKIFVSVGQSVGRGETIGMMGTTGRSTGTHLHFEVRINGVKKNPLSYIR